MTSKEDQYIQWLDEEREESNQFAKTVRDAGVVVGDEVTPEELNPDGSMKSQSQKQK